ncbi:MAG: hypothetical protein HY026_05480 [Deltaproteobacteria bacterium]|nr:hypothetical protein [Deltaproteobacteria bacterium]
MNYDIILNKVMQLCQIRRFFMKRFFATVVFCLMIGSFLAACATTANDKRGSGGKKSMPRPAQEEVVPESTTPQDKK